MDERADIQAAIFWHRRYFERVSRPAMTVSVGESEAPTAPLKLNARLVKTPLKDNVWVRPLNDSLVP